MIRPLTIITLCAAAGAGLWLYQVKHSVAQLDRELREVNRRTEQARERTQVLRAEWALLNEPDRLRRVAQQHLPLEAMSPAQFVRLSEVERRLPAPSRFAGAPSLFAPTEPPGDGSPTSIAIAAAPRARDAAPVVVARVEPAAVEPAATPAPAVVAAAPAAAPEPQASAPAPRPAPTPRAAAPRPAVQRAIHVERRAPAPAPQQVAASVVRPAVVSSLGGTGLTALAPPVPIARAAAATLTPGTTR